MIKVMDINIKVTIAAIAVGMHAAAAPVDQATAQCAAENFLANSKVAARILSDREVSCVVPRGNLWIANLAPSGHVVVAGSTKCPPIVSFSPEDYEEPADDSPRKVLLDAAAASALERESDSGVSEHGGWNVAGRTARGRSLLRSTSTPGESVPYVEPLLGAAWHQGSPYNDFSPLNRVCGCMATAGAQELRYWRWPYRVGGSREYGHFLFDHARHRIRVNGEVPFYFDSILPRYDGGETRYQRYEASYLTLWVQSFLKMKFDGPGTTAEQKLCAEADAFGYEQGIVTSQDRIGYDALWEKIRADLDFGSPVQVNTPGHQMVIDGYAIENDGTENEIDWVNINFGWGTPVSWENLREGLDVGYSHGKLADFQIGFRPRKMVQIEPLPRVSESSVQLAWHLPPCHTNNVTGFTVEVRSTASQGDAETVFVESAGDETTGYVYTVEGLEDGVEYSFSVTPVMADGSEAVASLASTRIGTPAGAPSIESISVPYDNIELLQDGFYAECGIGVTNEIVVTCSESTTGLVALPSRLALLPDEKVSIVTNGNVFTVRLDATEIDDEWSGDMMMLTLGASNDDGTAFYTNMMLRIAKPCRVYDGTYEVVAAGDADKPIDWRGNNIVLDAKGHSLAFKSGTFTGGGTVSLRDSVGGGRFTIDGLDGFSGTIKVDSSCLAIAGHIPMTAHLNVTSSARIYLVGADVDPRVFSGNGTLSVTDGENTMPNFSAGTFDVSLFGGVLTVDPGDETVLPVYGGTLRVQLTDAHVAFGHSTVLSVLGADGSVEFIDSNGETVAAIRDGLKFTVLPADSTKIWTPTAATNDYSDVSCWRGGLLPSNGDYAIFDVAQDTTMNFDLQESVALEGLKITGGGRLTIADGDGDGELSAAKLVNDTEVEVATSRIVRSRLLPLATVTLQTAAFAGCEVESHLAGELKTADGESALTDAFWLGTIIYTGHLPAWLDPNAVGNSNSVVRLNGTSGYLAHNSPKFTVPVELIDDGDTPAFDWNNGSSASIATFSKLCGDGTLKTSGTGGLGERIVLNDTSDFTGSLDLSAKTVVIGEEVTTNTNNGLLDVNNGWTANIHGGKTWRIGDGVVLDGATAKLDVAGTLVTPTISALADNAQLVLSDGGVIEFGGVPTDGARINASLYAGTLRMTQDATATDGMCFSSTNSACTVVDVNGHELTFAAGAISGHGTIYPTSTASEPGAVVFEDFGYFAGRIIIDGTTQVRLPSDMAGSDATLEIRGVEMAFAAGSEPRAVVSSGAKMRLTLTAEQMGAGYNATGVTVEGGEVEFRDLGGNLLATVTDGTPVAAPVSLAETGGIVSAFTSLAFRDTELSALTEDTLRGRFGGSYAGTASGAAAVFCCFAYPSEGVMTCQAQVFDDGMVKSVLLTFTQAGDDIHVVATGKAYKEGGTIGDALVPSSDGEELYYEIYGLRLAEVATIDEEREYALSELFDAITEDGAYFVKALETATLKVVSPTNVAGITFYVSDGKTLTLALQGALSADCVAVRGGGTLAVDARSFDVSSMVGGDRLMVLGGIGSAGVQTLDPPEATDELIYAFEWMADGLYIKAIPNRDWNTININFTVSGNNLTTNENVGLVGVPGTMWDNVVIGGLQGSLSTVKIVDSSNQECCEWPGLGVAFSNTRGSWICSSLSYDSDIRYGYIDDSGTYPTPTVEVAGIPFTAYRVVVYHATDTGGGKFGYDEVNGDNLTYTNGVLTTGTASWGNAGSQNSALPVGEGANTLVSGVYKSPTLTVVGHRENNSIRGCIAAIQVVKVESAAIDAEGDYTLAGLLGGIGVTSDIAIDVNESAVLDIGGVETMGALTLNIAEGKTLTLAGATNAVSRGVYIGGAGKIAFNTEPAWLPKFIAEGENRWTGTFVMGWTVENQGNGTAWVLDNYGIDGSTVEVANDITAGFFMKPSGNSPSVKPAVYFDGNVTISDGYSGENQKTTFASVGMSEGKTFRTRGGGYATYYAFTSLENFDGTIEVRTRDHVEVGTIVCDAMPTPGEIVARVVKKSANAELDGETSILVRGVDRVIPAVYTNVVNGVSGEVVSGFAAKVQTVTVPAVAGTVVSVTADGEPVEGDNGVYAVIYGQSVVVTYGADTAYFVEDATIEFEANDDIDLAEDDWGKPTVTPAVACVGATYYRTLLAAVDAAVESGEEVELLADSADDLLLANGSTVTINDNGHSYVAPIAEDESYTVEASETVEGVTTYTGRDWHVWVVTYANWDGTELQNTNVSESAPATPGYTGELPTKEPTAQFTYSFVGWGDVADTVSGDVTYTAQFEGTTRCYVVTWLDDDGTVLGVTENVAYGSAVPAREDPTKTLEPPYTQAFAHWSPSFAVVESNTTYRAVYFDKIADLSTLASDWAAADGDVITNTTEYAIRIPGGASVTINGVKVSGMGGDSTPAIPEFAEGGSSEVARFERTDDGKWLLTCYLDIANDASGTSVDNGMVKVYSADSVDALDSAEPMDDGVNVIEKKSAVKMTFEVTAPPDAPSQFFRVKAASEIR